MRGLTVLEGQVCWRRHSRYQRLRYWGKVMAGVFSGVTLTRQDHFSVLRKLCGRKSPTVYIDGLFVKYWKNKLVDVSGKTRKALKKLHLCCLAKARVAGSNPVSRSNFLKHLHNTLRRFHSHCDSFVISEGKRAPESTLPLLNSPANDARSAAS